MNDELDLFAGTDSEPPGPETEVRVLYLDTETTGADPEKAVVCEVALLLTTYRGFTRDRDTDVEYATLVKPPVMVPPEASAIHHITNAMLEGKPCIEDLAGDIRKLVDAADYVSAHNLPYDLAILRRQLPGVFGSITPDMELDSLRLARHLWPLVSSHALQALRYRFELDSGISGEAHRALFDTMLVRALVESVVGGGSPDWPDWKELSEFARSPLDVQVFSFGKYRGKLVEDVLASDVDYIRWLIRQKWMAGDYPDLYHTLLTKTGSR